VHNVSDVRQIEVHTTEPLVSGPSHVEIEIAVAKLKKYKSLVVIKIRQNGFKQGVKYCCSGCTNSLILFGIRKNCLISGRSLLLYQVAIKDDKTDCNNYRGYHCYELYTECYRLSFSQS
jgi:hypothetical protein